MTNLDKKIEQALNSATGSLAITDEPSVVEDVLATFQGQYKTLLIMAWAKMFAASALMIFSVYQFFYATSMLEMLAYATLTTVCTVTVASIYILFWISLNKHTTNREVKKLELQIALLIHKLETPGRPQVMI